MIELENTGVSSESGLGETEPPGAGGIAAAAVTGAPGAAGQRARLAGVNPRTDYRRVTPGLVAGH